MHGTDTGCMFTLRQSFPEVQRLSGIIRGCYSDDPTLAGEVIRIVTEHLADRLHLIANRDVGLTETHRGTGSVRNFMCNGRQAAARRISHEAESG